MGNRKFRVYRLQIDTNNTPGQALQFMQRFVRRDIGGNPSICGFSLSNILISKISAPCDAASSALVTLFSKAE